MEAVAGIALPLKTKAYDKQTAGYYEGPAEVFLALENLSTLERWDETAQGWIAGEPVLADNIPTAYTRDGDWAYTIPAAATEGLEGTNLRAYLLTTTTEAAEVLVAADRLIQLTGDTSNEDLRALLEILTGGALNPVSLHLTAATVDVPGALLEVWDASGTYVLRRGFTNVVGIMATGGLAAGDYVVRGSLLGFLIAEQLITVPEGGGTVELVAQQLTLNPPPGDPSLCNLYGYLSDVGAVNRAGVEIHVTPLQRTVINGRHIDRRPIVAPTDENGAFSIAVYQGVLIQVRCEEARYNKRTTLETATQDWKDIA